MLNNIHKQTTIKQNKLQKTRSAAVYPWIVWGLGALFLFYKYLLQVSPSVMSDDLMRAFHISGVGLGHLAACYFYSYLIMQIPVGILLDHYSPRKLTTLAIVVCAVSVLLFARVDNLWLAGLTRALIGLGAAFAAVSCLKYTTIWFPPQRFALISGLMMTAAMLGAVGGEAPLAHLVAATGWRTALYYCAFPGLLLALLFWVIVRDKPTTTNSSTATTGLSLQGFWVILQNPQNWLLALYSGLAFAPVSVFGGLWGVPFLEMAHHLTKSTAATAVSMIFIGFAVGCPLAGWFSDFLGRRLIVMVWGTAIALVALLAVLYWPSLSAWVLGSLLFIFGFAISSFLLCFAMTREIQTLALAATALGFMNTFDSVCEAVSEPLIGKILDLGWQGQMQAGVPVFSLHNYHLALLLLPAYLIVALGLLKFINETYCRQQVD